MLESPDTPDLALLDWVMPEMDGPEVCRRIRMNATHHPKYIILLSAKARPEDVIEGLQAGADAYVTKPFAPEGASRNDQNVGVRVVSKV